MTSPSPQQEDYHEEALLHDEERFYMAKSRDDTPCLAQRILAVMRDVGYVQKTTDVRAGGGSYKAVGHDEVVRVVRAGCVEHGICILPSIHDVVNATVEVKTNNGIKLIRVCDVVARVTLVNADSPRDRITIDYPGHGEDYGDKASGKAISYACKYALLKAFMLETGDQEEERIAEREEARARKVTAKELKQQGEKICDQLGEVIGIDQANAEKMEIWESSNGDLQRFVGGLRDALTNAQLDQSSPIHPGR